MEAMLQRAFNTRSQSFPPLVNGLIHDALLQSSPRPNKPLPRLVIIPNWHSVHTLLHHAPDAVVHGIKVGTVGWPHVRTNELRCLAAERPARQCHKHDVLVRCLAGRRRCLQQCCGSLEAAAASTSLYCT